ncbi:MAG: SpoIIE family protein phosphatase, partial [Spirochaetota bacterium]
LFLDDLQWADPPSLKLIELFLTDPDEKYILIIGAYRDNEVDAAHPLMAMLEDIQTAGVEVSTLTLPPLELQYVNQLISDTLKCDLSETKPLAELSYQKTEGNPFFLNQFLQSVYEAGLIEFDSSKGVWTWDVKKIQDQGITDNVVDLMAEKIQKLSQSTQEVLQLAASIGNRFDLKTLSIVREKSPIETANDLWEGMQVGLVIPTDDAYKFLQKSDKDPKVSYRFLHDRVQQAAYALIAEDERDPIHLKIGRLLLENTRTEEFEEKIFDIIGQINSGRKLIEDEKEKLGLAEWNLQAGKKARNSSAYQAASQHMKIGIEMLPPDAWEKHYELTLSLYRGQAEAEYLSGQFEQAEALYPIALKQAKTAMDKVSVYAVQTAQYQLQGRFLEAIEIQREGLELLGMSIPKSEEELGAMVGQGFQEVTENLKGREIEDLVKEGKMTGVEHLAMMQLLLGMWYASYLAGQTTLNAVTTIKMTNLSLLNGNSEISSFGYVNYAFIIAFILGEFKTGYRFGRMAIELSDQQENTAMRASTYFLYATFTHHWNQPLRSSDPYYDKGYEWGMESGDFATVGYIIAVRSTDRTIYGKSLPELLKICERDLVLLQGTKQQDMIDCTLVGTIQSIRNLMGLTDSPFSYDDENFNEAEFLKNYAEAPLHLAYFYYGKIRNAYLFEDRKHWLQMAEQLPTVEMFVPGQNKIPEATFYTALIFLAECDSVSEAERAQYFEKIAPLREKMKIWSDNCPANFLHRHYLIEAEIARVEKDEMKAMDLYLQAIDSSKNNEYINLEALSNELYGKFWLRKKQTRIAEIYLKDAHYLYGRWGAFGKVKAMEKAYPQLLTQDTTPKIGTRQTINMTTTTTGGSELLDLGSVMKASQAISEEIVVERLLKNMMQVVIENAGAQTGLFLLEQEGEWFIEAEGSHEKDAVVSSSRSLKTSDGSYLAPASIIQYVARTKKSVVLADASHEGNYMSDPYIQENNPKSVLCAPVIHQGKISGILYLENNGMAGVFTEERLNVLHMLSTQVAISLENARLYASIEDATRVVTEMKIAEQIQTSLLPQDLQVDGLQITAHMQTADEVGGDYYDVIRDGEKTWFIIGDVSGHGVTAGLIMMMAQTAIHSVINTDASLSLDQVLVKANEVITANIQLMGLNKYMTLTLFLHDGEKFYFTGLHQDIIIYRANTKKVDTLETRGTWLGMAHYTNQYFIDPLELNPSDTMILYTDGITEAKDSEGEMLDIDGLVDFMSLNGELSTESIKDKLLEKMSTYETDDDITFMVLKKIEA